MDYLDLLLKHMALECIQLDGDGDLVRLPCSVPDDIPRLYVAHHRGNFRVYFRSDVPLNTRQRLLVLSPDRFFADHEQVKSLLDAAAAGTGAIWHGRSYVFSGEPVIEPKSDIQYTDQSDRCMIVIDDQVVAQCMSVRANQDSAEAYVEIHPDFRRQGLGKRVTYAWAQWVKQSGRIPFYSHHVDNTASQRLAETLGFVKYIDDIGYE